MKCGERAIRPLTNDGYCTCGIFFSVFVLPLCPVYFLCSLSPSPHFSTLCPMFFFLDLLMCIVIRTRTRSRCSSSLGFEAWMYSLPS
jgi:hypothetical protein